MVWACSLCELKLCQDCWDEDPHSSSPKFLDHPRGEFLCQSPFTLFLVDRVYAENLLEAGVNTMLSAGSRPTTPQPITVSETTASQPSSPRLPAAIDGNDGGGESDHVSDNSVIPLELGESAFQSFPQSILIVYLSKEGPKNPQKKHSAAPLIPATPPG